MAPGGRSHCLQSHIYRLYSSYVQRTKSQIMAPNIHPLKLTEAERHLKTGQRLQVVTVLLAGQTLPWLWCLGGAWRRTGIGTGNLMRDHRPHHASQCPALPPLHLGRKRSVCVEPFQTWQATCCGGDPQIYFSVLLQEQSQHCWGLGLLPGYSLGAVGDEAQQGPGGEPEAGDRAGVSDPPCKTGSRGS